jgi:hypothetical protein
VKPDSGSDDPPQAHAGSPAKPTAASASDTQAASSDDDATAPPLPPNRKAVETQHPKPRKLADAVEPKPANPGEHKSENALEHKSAKPPTPKAASKPVNTSVVAERAPAPQQATEPPPSGLATVLQNVFGGSHDAPSTAAASNASPRAPEGSSDGFPGPRAGARWSANPPAGTTTIARSATDAAPVTVKLASSVSQQAANEILSRLQKQFPGLLANGVVRREDMGKFGVFYRVRVGPLSREAADKMCAQLKASGASCSFSGG